ncbi:outer membrane lipoprotein LolB [Ramlibacter rhizophilus]|uniref:Outer-membrane lipoprotein LolB n=2 Tax=Ramlibacter rhizophilus TaxID=1781167 RepID=A0A4Z0BTV3_9BURK|nr:outer membrane lipoprotein LolB [Ramlibacter rhizophilus]
MRLGLWLLLACLFTVLAGCASRLRAPSAEAAELPRWSGRLAVRVDSEPRQSVSAGFELRGSPERGELALFTPVGSTAAVLSWAPGLAVLRESGGEPRGFPSLEALITHALGTQVPVETLFDWLRGRPGQAEGWQADLSRHAEGRLVARRDSPAPPAELRIVLETP